MKKKNLLLIILTILGFALTTIAQTVSIPKEYLGYYSIPNGNDGKNI